MDDEKIFCVLLILSVFVICDCESKTTISTTLSSTSATTTQTTTTQNVGYEFDMDGYLEGLESRREYIGDYILSNTDKPSQSNPWIEANVGNRIITYTYKGHSYTINFNDYTNEYK